MGEFSSPVLSFACPLRLPNRTSISDEVPIGLSDLERRLPHEVQLPPACRLFGKPLSCLVTPPEVTAAVAKERRTRSSQAWGWRTKAAPAREAERTNATAPRAGAGTIRGSGVQAGTAAGACPRSVGRVGYPVRPGAPVLINRVPHGGRSPTSSLRLLSGPTWQVCGKAGPRLGTCSPQTYLRVGGEGHCPPLTTETQGLIDRISVFKYFGF